MQRFLRQWHRRLSLIIALPFLLTVVTGVIMMTRSFNPLVATKSPEIHAELRLSFADIMRIAQTVPSAEVKSSADITQINAQPKTGIIRVRTANWHEIMIHGETGEVLATGPRTMSWLIALHEGAYFGKIVQFGLFLPMGLIVLFLLISGTLIYYYFWRNQRALRQR